LTATKDLCSRRKARSSWMFSAFSISEASLLLKNPPKQFRFTTVVFPKTLKSI